MITSALLLFGQAVTPAAAQEAEAEAACNKPVYMVVEGRTFDRQRMGEYALAIAQSGIYQELGGYNVNNPRPLAVFEGDVPSDYVKLTVRFPRFFNDPGMDRFVAVAMNLAQEVWVQEERLLALEEAKSGECVGHEAKVKEFIDRVFAPVREA